MLRKSGVTLVVVFPERYFFDFAFIFLLLLCFVNLLRVFFAFIVVNIITNLVLMLVAFLGAETIYIQ